MKKLGYNPEQRAAMDRARFMLAKYAEIYPDAGNFYTEKGKIAGEILADLEYYLGEIGAKRAAEGIRIVAITTLKGDF